MITVVDTANTSYLTAYGLSILRNEPYHDIAIKIQENSIVEPAPSHRRFTNSSKECSELGKSGRSDVVSDSLLISDVRQESPIAIRSTKRTHSSAFSEEEEEDEEQPSKSSDQTNGTED